MLFLCQYNYCHLTIVITTSFFITRYFRRNNFGSKFSVIRCGEISPLRQNVKSLDNFWRLVKYLANLYNRQIYIATNGQILNQSPKWPNIEQMI